MTDESIKVKHNTFSWTGRDQMRIICGMRVSYSLPLDHPLAVFVERVAEQSAAGTVSLPPLLAELLKAPLDEEVTALLLAVLRLMRHPIFDAKDMRKLCAFYVRLVNLLPYDPPLYRLVSEVVLHGDDDPPDRLLNALLEVVEKREKVREEHKLALVLTWGDGPRVESFFEKRIQGHDDFSDTDAGMPAIIHAGLLPAPAPTPLLVGPRRFTLKMKPLPAPKSPPEN